MFQYMYVFIHLTFISFDPWSTQKIFLNVWKIPNIFIQLRNYLMKIENYRAQCSMNSPLMTGLPQIWQFFWRCLSWRELGLFDYPPLNEAPHRWPVRSDGVWNVFFEIKNPPILLIFEPSKLIGLQFCRPLFLVSMHFGPVFVRFKNFVVVFLKNIGFLLFRKITQLCFHPITLKDVFSFFEFL